MLCSPPYEYPSAMQFLDAALPGAVVGPIDNANAVTTAPRRRCGGRWSRRQRDVSNATAQTDVPAGLSHPNILENEGVATSRSARGASAGGLTTDRRESVVAERPFQQVDPRAQFVHLCPQAVERSRGDFAIDEIRVRHAKDVRETQER